MSQSTKLLSGDPSSAKIDVHGATDVGKTRTENQDHFLIADLQRMLNIRQSSVAHEDCDRLFGSRPGQLLVVADGMGGHADGERASSTAIESCARYVLDMMHWFLKLSPENENDFMDELSDCLKVIQKRLWSAGGNSSSRMGTTVTMAYIVYPRMYVVHAGDSRCYLSRDGELRQLTTDHTYAQTLVNEGAMSAAEAETSRWRHVLWNCVGGGEKVVQPEVAKVNLQESDTVLLCSDGLTGMVSDQLIAATLEEEQTSPSAVGRLVDLANQAGGRDNIAVIVARQLKPDGPVITSEECFGTNPLDTIEIDDTDVR